MPYIPHEDRLRAATDPRTPGELNYAITALLVAYSGRAGRLTYGVLNDCLGALASAQFEFYRRIVVPYEQDKIATNGDVY